jgi:signal-transduction protein with cAMP-binding, CBS, and nucleotidyltransferase domain
MTNAKSAVDAGAAPARKPRRVSRTAAFSEIVRDHMDLAPAIMPEHTACAEVIRAMREQGGSSVLIADADGRLKGIVTERDVVRHIAYQASGSTQVEQIMSAPVLTIRDDDYLFHAIATMRRRDLRHMPAVDKQGRVVGMLHLHVVLAEASATLMEQIDRLTHEESVEGLHQVKSAQVEVADTLFAENVPVPEIQGLLTQINNDIYRRILELFLKDMEEEGWGQPPVKLCVIVMGSGGRGESFLFPDQDNGFILEDYPDSRHGAVDPFFIELAGRMTRALGEVGITLCRGNVMATNPLWRKTLGQWCGQIHYWLRCPNPLTLRLSDIFFDFRSVFGQHELSDRLRDHLTRNVKGQHAFLQEMRRVQADHGVALGLFGRLTTDRTPGPNQGKLNLKYHGLLPLVESTRLLALREGIPETGTLARIAALHALGVLDANEQDYLSGGFHHLTRLILRQQISDFQEGREVSAYVSPRALSMREKDMLKNSLQAIDALRDRVKTEFTADVF